MKKLLCMALAIMLLVSAVPMCAMAVEGEFESGVMGLEAGEMGGDSRIVTDNQQSSENDLMVAAVDDTARATSITVDAVLITHDAITGGNSRTRTVQVPYDPSATLNDVLMNARGLNQSARTDGIAESAKYDYRVIALNDSQSFNELTHYDCGNLADYADVPLSNFEQNGHVYLQYYRTRKLVDVTLRLDGSNHGDYIKKDVPLYSSLNLPAEFSAAKLAPNTGYYIAYYEDGGRLISKNSVSSYLITQDGTVITGFQDLTANKPINDGNTNTSGGSNTNGGSSDELNGGSSGSSSSDRNRFPYDVVLHIYMNNKVDEPIKNIVISDSLASDGVVSLSEVKNEVFKYFNAKTAAGIGFAGLYYARGNWVKDYATYNGEYDSIPGINSMRQTSQVDINVMITNAKTKTSSSTADSSNPKTGDTIFVPVMVMGLTASALAAAYVFGKKRFAR